MRVLVQLTALAAVTVLGTGVAFGQGTTTSTISGVVLDAAGAVVPGADITARHDATGVTHATVSNSQGAFVFPSLNIGSYTVTVTLTGFKTFVASDVVLTSGAPANVRAMLELGGVTEQVVVSSISEIVQTQSSTISHTINTNQITKLPLTSRSAMDFVTFLPGLSTPGGNRDSIINGLPQGVINITLDGINVQDNTNRSTDGFFAIVSPRLDAIEEVTVTSAGQGADAGGQGAVQIKFVTRSGTNQFSGSGYHYYRHDTLNANTWFNNRNGVNKPKLEQNQGGFRAGGPIVLPGLYDGRSRAFFFVNYEEFRQPSDTTRNRTVLNTAATQGLFTYTAGGVTRSINVLDVARQNGQLSTIDPTIGALLSDIRTAIGGTGAISTIDSNLDRFSYNLSVTSLRRYPTGRVDFNLTDKHRFTSAINFQYFTDTPDTLNNFDATFPEFPVEAGQSSKRLGISNSLRSTLARDLVNEVRVGYSGAPVQFFDELNVGMYTGSLANTKGFHLTLGNLTTSNNTALTNAGATPTPQSRNATDVTIEDTVTWLKGKHSLTGGVSFSQYSVWLKNSNLVPRISFGVLSSDPAQGLFTTANFPNASSQNLTAASNLYALLTGRVTTITGDARLNESTGEYEYMGLGLQRSRMRETGIFLQDSWRLRPNFTLNAGVRYDVQFPFYALNNSYSTPTLADMCGVSGVNNPDDGHALCNLFQAGVTPGRKPEFHNLAEGDHAYNVDWDNVAPNVGFAWSPSRRDGLLGTLTGDEFVVRGGYSRAFSRNGMGDFTGQYNQNPGVVITATRSDANGNLTDGRPLPVLFRETERLGAPPFAQTPVYPMTDVVTADINMFDPNIQVPWADSWTAGIQRSLGRSMALEVRYVGTRSRDGWTQLNYNEVNIFDNGFLAEFRQAQANLAANIAAGRGNTFAYTGAAGTAPLPTFLAFFNGLPSSQAGNTGAYTGTNWTSSTFLGFLAARNPNPFGMVFNDPPNNATPTGMLNNATMRANAARAGVPANFFVANPDLLGGVDYTTNGGKTDYNSLQIELRRRLSQGLQFQTSYVFGKAMQSRFETFRRDRFMVRDTGTPGDVTHAFKAIVVYDLPFGQGRRFAGNANGLVDRLVGGWQLGVATRLQSGRLIDLGNHRVVGMSMQELQDAYRIRFDHDGKRIWMLPQDIIDNTILAFSVSPTSANGYAGSAPGGRYLAPANGPDCIEVDPGANSLNAGDYGECGARSIVLTGPTFRQTDIRVSKRTPIVGRINVELAAEMLNAFNMPNFVPVGGIGTSVGAYEVTALTGTNTARTIQIVTRINW